MAAQNSEGLDIHAAGAGGGDDTAGADDIGQNGNGIVNCITSPTQGSIPTFNPFSAV